MSDSPPPPRSLSAIIADVLKSGHCPEVYVEYSCGHTSLAKVNAAPFVQEKREPRAATRTLRTMCRRGTLPPGEASIFRVEVPAGLCSSCSTGSRASLWCGGVAMDLSAAGQPVDQAVPVGLIAQQFLEWLEMPLSGRSAPRIQLLTSSAIGTISWYSFFTTISDVTMLLLGIALWLLGCVVYAVSNASELMALPPEAFYQQIQQHIREIPLPFDSPNYAHYRRYYLEQYQQYLTDFRTIENEWKEKGPPWFNWSALIQGLGLGLMPLAVALAFCEFRYGTLSVGAEVVEDWCLLIFRWLRSPPRDPLADTHKQAIFLREAFEIPLAEEPVRESKRTVVSPSTSAVFTDTDRHAAEGCDGGSASQRMRGARRRRGSDKLANRSGDGSSASHGPVLSPSSVGKEAPGQSQEHFAETHVGDEVVDSHRSSFVKPEATDGSRHEAIKALEATDDSTSYEPKELSSCVSEESTFPEDVGGTEFQGADSHQRCESQQSVPCQMDANLQEAAHAANIQHKPDVGDCRNGRPCQGEFFVAGTQKQRLASLREEHKETALQPAVNMEDDMARGDQSVASMEDHCQRSEAQGFGHDSATSPQHPHRFEPEEVTLPPGLEPYAAHAMLPKDLENLSTNELIDLLRSEKIRDELAMRGIQVRGHLLRCLGRLKAGTSSPAHASSTSSNEVPGSLDATVPSNSASCSAAVAGIGSGLRAEAPEFMPTVVAFDPLGLGRLDIDGVASGAFADAGGFVQNKEVEASAFDFLEPTDELPADASDMDGCFPMIHGGLASTFPSMDSAVAPGVVFEPFEVAPGTWAIHEYCRHANAAANARWHASMHRNKASRINADMNCRMQVDAKQCLPARMVGGVPAHHAGLAEPDADAADTSEEHVVEEHEDVHR